MTNPLRGHIDLAAGDTTLTLRFSVNAIVAVEDALDVPIVKVADLFTDVENLRIGKLRTLFRCALVDTHPELTDEQAGELMEVAGMEKSASALGRAFATAFPEVAAGAKRPQVRKTAGTGKPS